MTDRSAHDSTPERGTFVPEEIRSALLGNVSSILEETIESDFSNMVDALESKERVFVTGAGRSGLVGRFLAMRLTHFGKMSYVVGETTTPSIQEGDLCVAISSSGKTSTVVHVATTAREVGAAILAITSEPASPLASIATVVVRLRASSEQAATQEVKASSGVNVFPMGTIFELSALMLCESAIGSMIARNSTPEAMMRLRHANLE